MDSNVIKIIKPIKDETDYQFMLFHKFVELGTLADVQYQFASSVTINQIYYLAKKFEWQERIKYINDYTLYLAFDNELPTLIESRKNKIKNTIRLFHSLDDFAKVFLEHFPNNNYSMRSELKNDTQNMLTYMNKVNGFIKTYAQNHNSLIEILSSYGIDINDLSTHITKFNFKNNETFENIENIITEEELEALNSPDFGTRLIEHNTYNTNKQLNEQNQLESLQRDRFIEIEKSRNSNYDKSKDE